MKLPKNARIIIDTLKKNNFEVYAVGGSVRDTIIGRETHDWDFATSATPEHILDLFPDSFYDNEFGTVGVKIKDTNGVTQDVFEVTTYRSEKEYKDFRHPDNVTWGDTIQTDLSRRDFTINAIASDGSTIIDPYDGSADIQNKLIRAVGEPEKRFAEDALRMMRAVRIAAQLGFQIEDKTKHAITAHADLLKHISQERIHDELVKILASLFPADGILLLKQTSLLDHILPELMIAFDTPQKSPKRHHLYDVGTHCVESLRHCPSEDPITRFATLLHDIGKPKTFKKTSEGVITFYNHEVVGARMAKDICKRLRFSKADTQKVYTLVRWHQFSVNEHQTDAAIRRFLRRIGLDLIDDMLALREGDRLGGGAKKTSWRLELYKKRILEVQHQPFSVKDLKINGNDIMNLLNITPGPIIGELLDTLFAEVEAETLENEKDILLDRVKKIHKTSD